MEQVWREKQVFVWIFWGKCRFLSWFGCIPPGRPPSISHIRWIHATLQARERYYTLFHYQPVVWTWHIAFIIFIFSFCLLLAHLFLYRLCTISQEQVARDGGERFLLITPRGLWETKTLEFGLESCRVCEVIVPWFIAESSVLWEEEHLWNLAILLMFPSFCCIPRGVYWKQPAGIAVCKQDLTAPQPSRLLYKHQCSMAPLYIHPKQQNSSWGWTSPLAILWGSTKSAAVALQNTVSK